MDFAIASKGVKRDSGQGAAHFEASESGGDSGLFSGLQQERSQATPGILGRYKDGTDLRGIEGRIEEIHVRRFEVLISTVKRSTATPATTAGQGFVVGKRDEIRAVRDKAGVDCKYGCKRTVNLRRGVVTVLKTTHGFLDEGTNGWDI